MGDNLISKDDDNNQAHLKKIDLDSLIPSNPQRNSRESDTINRRVYMSRPPLKNP